MPVTINWAQKLLEYADIDIQTFDVEQMHVTLECIVIYGTGKLYVRNLDGSIVEL